MHALTPRRDRKDPEAVPPPAAGNRATLFDTCCDRWADGSGRTAMALLGRDGRVQRVTFDALRSAAARFAAVLRGHGIARRDRVAILLDQGPEALVALFAAARLGAVAVPLPPAAGAAALAACIRDSRCAALVTDGAGLDTLHAHRLGLAALRVVFCVDGGRDGALSFWQEAGRASDDWAAAPVPAGDPALLLHGTGATGHPRAVLHAHRGVAGQAPGFVLRHPGALAPGGLVWTVEDWAGWTGLLDTVLPALFHGSPVLAHRLAAFDPQAALHVMLHAGVRSAALPPAHLRRLHEMRATPPRGHRIASLATAGAAIGQELIDWLREDFGTTVSDGLLRPECGLVLCTAGRAAPARAGCFGIAPPGRQVAVLDAAGEPAPAGQAGRIAVRRPDPALFLGYWRDPAAGRSTWVLTGQDGVMDAAGCISAPAPSRSAGGVGEVEAVLLAHPAVAGAALVSAAGLGLGRDATALVVPRQGAAPGPALAAELRGFLRARLSEAVCPRRVAFARELPARRGALGEAVGLGDGV